MLVKMDFQHKTLTLNLVKTCENLLVMFIRNLHFVKKLHWNCKLGFALKHHSLILNLSILNDHLIKHILNDNLVFFFSQFYCFFVLTVLSDKVASKFFELYLVLFIGRFCLQIPIFEVKGRVACLVKQSSWVSLCLQLFKSRNFVKLLQEIEMRFRSFLCISE